MAEKLCYNLTFTILKVQWFARLLMQGQKQNWWQHTYLKAIPNMIETYLSHSACMHRS